jgi:hypothetical protein
MGTFFVLHNFSRLTAGVKIVIPPGPNVDVGLGSSFGVLMRVKLWYTSNAIG